MSENDRPNDRTLHQVFDVNQLIGQIASGDISLGYKGKTPVWITLCFGSGRACEVTGSRHRLPVGDKPDVADMEHANIWEAESLRPFVETLLKDRTAFVTQTAAPSPENISTLRWEIRRKEEGDTINDQVEAMPFEQKIGELTLERGSFAEGGIMLPTRVVRQEFQPAISGFVGIFMLHHLPTLVISHKVPPGFREHYFRHEIFCRMTLKDEPEHCAVATRRELEQVPAEIRAEYIRRRIALYKSLLEYYETSENQGLKDDLNSGLRYLQSLTP